MEEQTSDSKNKKKLAFSLLGSLAIVAFLIWFSLLFTKGEENKLTVNFLDVGQGDAILIQSPKGEVLIDGGPGKQILEKIGEIMPFSDRKIELVILTHPDSDHINGLVEVLKNYRVDKIMETGIENDNQGYQEWKKLIKEKNITLVLAKKGDKIELGEGITLDFLWPDGQTFISDKELNNSSIVNLLDWGEMEAIFTGDAETFVLDKIAEQNQGIDIEILKQPHHGSKTGISEKFLEVSKIEFNDNDFKAAKGFASRSKSAAETGLAEVKKKK